MANTPPEHTTGTPTPGKADGVPVVDLTELLRHLDLMADSARERHLVLMEAAAAEVRLAEYLESLASTLAGADHAGT